MSSPSGKGIKISCFVWKRGICWYCCASSLMISLANRLSGLWTYEAWGSGTLISIFFFLKITRYPNIFTATFSLELAQGRGSAQNRRASDYQKAPVVAVLRHLLGRPYLRHHVKDCHRPRPRSSQSDFYSRELVTPESSSNDSFIADSQHQRRGQLGGGAVSQ